MKLNQHRFKWIFIAVIVVSLLIFAVPPQQGKLHRGSTYTRSPDGYGAWYVFMEQRGTPIRRWQKPLEDWLTNPTLSSGTPVTLLRVHSFPVSQALSSSEQKWVEQGNTLIQLGVRVPVTEAQFSTLQESEFGDVKIETRRRFQSRNPEHTAILSDRFGAVVWEQSQGNGKAIYSSTPDLAANAYQDYPANYELLAQLVTASGHPIWVDEYLHGYRDPEIRERMGQQSWIRYLSNTPIPVILLQASIILAVLIWERNQRFGLPTQVKEPIPNNSQAYVKAIAGTLEKANSRPFVIEIIGREEQLQLQKTLGLSSTQLDSQGLIEAWMQQTGKSAAELQSLLTLPHKKRQMSEQELLTWLEKWQKARLTIQEFAKLDHP